MTDIRKEKVRFTSNMSFVANGKVTITNVGAKVDDNDKLSPEFEDGFQAGLRQGTEAAEERIESLKTKIVSLEEKLATIGPSIVNVLSERLEELEKQACVECTALAFMVAERIVHREIQEENPIRLVIAEAIERLTHLSGVKLMLAPTDFQLLSAESGTVPPGIELILDASLRPGELFLESPQGFLDGKITTRLHELKEQFEQLSLVEETVDAESD